jgi:hypothetical protein
MSGSFGDTMEQAEDLRINKKEFDQETLDDVLRVDRLCQGILKHFYLSLQGEGHSPEAATRLAASADYFVRDFVVDNRVRNLFEERIGLVRQFAGNWYIVNTLEPDIKDLGEHLTGIAAFYRFLHDRKLISSSYLKRMEKECADLPYYESRIESFWAIKGDGYEAWEKVCSLKDD